MDERPASKKQSVKRYAVPAITQLVASVLVAALGIASFKLLNPEGMALFRHLYFTPFTIAIGASSASHSYLRSLLFGQPASEMRRAEMRSLIVVNTIASLAILAVVFGMLTMEFGSPPILAATAVTGAVAVFSLRFVLLCRLEFLSRYGLSIIIGNISSLLPYIAVVIYWLANSQTLFFTGVLVLNALLGVAMLRSLNHFAPNVSWRSFLTAAPRFKFSFGKFTHIAMFTLGMALSFQGVEFLFYTVTRYENTEIANYALAFTAAAMLRQLVNAFLQPLQKKETAASSLKIRGHQFAVPMMAETVTVAALIVACLIIPTIFNYVFPNYQEAQFLIPPLILGVLGTSVFQVYAVQFIPASRVAFLAWSQMTLAVLSMGAVWLLSDHMSLVHMAILLSLLQWLRGLVLTPLYARAHGFHTMPSLWLVRAAGSIVLIGLAIA